MTFHQDFKVRNAPPSLYYIPNFISPEEETYLIDKINSAPKPKWTQLMNRRLQNWGGIPHTNGMIAEDIPQWLMQFVERVNNLNIYDEGKIKANHVLVNEYCQGQGILAHTDGPLFFPTIANISCGSHTVLLFQTTNSSPPENKIGVLLEPCSLVIVKDLLYTDYLHSISEICEDILDPTIVNIDKTSKKVGDKILRNTRLSITIRHVPKTSKLKIKLCK